MISKGLLLKSPAIALQSNKASLRYNSEKLTFTKCTHTTRRLPQEFTHRKKLFQTQPRSLVNEAKKKALRQRQRQLLETLRSVCDAPASSHHKGKQTNKQSSFQTTPRRESGYENSKLNPQFSQTTTITAIDRREANKQQLQQYSQGRNEGRKEGRRDRSWAAHNIAGNWGKTIEEVQVLKNEC